MLGRPKYHIGSDGRAAPLVANPHPALL